MTAMAPAAAALAWLLPLATFVPEVLPATGAAELTNMPGARIKKSLTLYLSKQVLPETVLQTEPACEPSTRPV